MNCKISRVVLDPEQRKNYLTRLLDIEGFSLDRIRNLAKQYGYKPLEELVRETKDITEIERQDYCYCALPLTGVPAAHQDKILYEHNSIKDGIKRANIHIYDPAEAPFNPQHGLIGQPTEVSDIDTLMVASSKFFEFTNVAPSTGGGIEQRTATIYNKIVILLVKGRTYVSRMSTGARRALVLEYSDIEQDQEDISQIFSMLMNYEIGIGECNTHHNSLVGFNKGKPLCLKGLIESTFPEFKYDFNQYLKK